MKLEGQFKLSAPIQQVWDTLLSPEILAACVPGCEELEEIDDNTYASIVAAKVGAVSARFKFTTKLTEIEPPTRLKATGSGEEMKKMATFTQETVVNLEELSDSEVQVSYQANVNIVGKLATFGDRIMKAKAAQVQEEFTQALAARLSSQATAKPAEEPAEEPTEEDPSEEPTEEPAAKPKAKPKAKAKPAAESKAMTTTALNVTTWELIVAFFSVLWEKLVGLFKGSPK